MIGIIGAMEEEIDRIKEKMEVLKVDKISSFYFYIGKLCGRNIVLAKSNEGKVNSAMCTQTMILKYEIDLVINVGVAGSLTDKLNIGGIALTSRTVEYDFDTTALGYDLGYTFGVGSVYVNCAKELVECIRNVSSKMYNTVCGTILSSDKFVSDESTKKFLKENFEDCIAVDMETASINHVCSLNNIPFCGIRAISDSTQAIEYRKFVNIATENLFSVLCKYLEYTSK